MDINEHCDKIFENKVSVRTLVFYWNSWKENVVDIFESLSSFDKEEPNKHEGYIDFSLMYFGVRKLHVKGNMVYLLVDKDAECKRKTQTGGWKSLGGILLCITGSEAMFADHGHFSQLSIQIAVSSFVYPSLILAYMGQAAYLSQHHVIENDYQIRFYISVPESLRIAVLLIAISAAVFGSQAIITGTFSIIKQCSSLGCFPRVKIVHTSSKYHRQIYIPESADEFFNPSPSSAQGT